MSTTIGIVIFEDAEELDFVGPWEVFTMAAMGREDLHVLTIAEAERPIRCAKGLRVIPDRSFTDAPPLDVVLVPGGQGTRREIDNPVLIDWLAESAGPCRWVTSVCTGSMLLHAAGLVKERRITTHWAFIETLRELAPDAEVLEGVRYVRDGNLVTAAGVSAGIDMALWLTGQLFGVEHARQTQRLMEYDPAPPYTAEV
ncbi:MAG: DJ-1/PfpI family protein [Deltaproteobacteria bacterium]|nr:DJ-1/PfpI family protein [Deltaproteobacteria bacterium]MBW2417934.1 DJ-1/PfpI family protein [Deltaproteobacteria bacterium]